MTKKIIHNYIGLKFRFDDDRLIASKDDKDYQWLEIGDPLTKMYVYDSETNEVKLKPSGFKSWRREKCKWDIPIEQVDKKELCECLGFNFNLVTGKCD